MKGLFPWYAVAVLIVSTGLNYSMVSKPSSSTSGGSSIMRSGGTSGGWHK